jgi:hypothetical protein
VPAARAAVRATVDPRVDPAADPAVRTALHPGPTARPVLPPGPARTAAFGLSAGVAALMLLASVLGLAVPGLYPEQPWAVAAFRGNDLVTLLVAAPVLLLAMLLARRGGVDAVLVWAGMLHYGVYNYAYYAFGAAFSDVFLLHVAALVLSIAGLVLLVAAVDPERLAERAAAVAATRPRATRLVAGFLVLVGSGLVAAWGGLSVRFALTGQVQQDVMPPSAVHLVYAIDLSLLAPVFLVGGVLLWCRVPWGHLMAVAVSASGFAYLAVLEVVGGFQADAGIAGKTWASPVGIGAPLLCLAALLTLLLAGRRPGRPAGRGPARPAGTEPSPGRDRSG